MFIFLLRRRAQQLAHFVAEDSGRADDEAAPLEGVVARADLYAVLVRPAGERRPTGDVDALAERTLVSC
jgi:hypothetical protein